MDFSKIVVEVTHIRCLTVAYRDLVEQSRVQLHMPPNNSLQDKMTNPYVSMPRSRTNDSRLNSVMIDTTRQNLIKCYQRANPYTDELLD